MERRVVVTGLGAVTPLGNDVKSTWENMIAGKNGIDFVTAFDIGSFKAKLAGEVKGFDPALYMPKGDVRKTDLYAQYAPCNFLLPHCYHRRLCLYSISYF